MQHSHGEPSRRLDIADHEGLRRPVVGELGAHQGRGIGHQHDIAERAVGAVGNGVEAGELNVGRCPADPPSEPHIQVARGKALTANLAGDIAAPGEYQFFPYHGLPDPVD